MIFDKINGDTIFFVDINWLIMYTQYLEIIFSCLTGLKWIQCLVTLSWSKIIVIIVAISIIIVNLAMFY